MDENKDSSIAEVERDSDLYDKRDLAIACSDLAAQWTVANYAHRGFWLGLIGLGFLGWTLIETRKAARAASDTLDVAHATLTEAKRSNNLNNRPWVIVETVSIGPVFRDADGIIRVGVCVKIRNTGQTPAMKIGFNVGIFYAFDNRPEVTRSFFKGALSMRGAGFGGSALAPNETRTINSKWVVSPDTISAAESESRETHQFKCYIGAVYQSQASSDNVDFASYQIVYIPETFPAGNVTFHENTISHIVVDTQMS